MILAAVNSPNGSQPQVIADGDRAKTLLCTACLAPFCALR
jgi:hypothetical protein